MYLFIYVLDLILTLMHQKINIAILTETKKTLRDFKEINQCTVLYGGVEQSQRATRGVAILFYSKLKEFNILIL